MQYAFLESVERTIEGYRLLEGVSRLVAGVSGGADSVAMLFALHHLRERYALTLIAAHLNHQIRGADAQADEDFVRELAASLDIPCISEKADVPALAKASGVSLEMAARYARLDFFRRTARTEQADAVAVAHTSDDQVETILLRLFRGCGLLGLSGIPYTNELNGLRIIRPLRDVTHQDAELFLKERKHPWREDGTNQETDYLRNRVRHEVLPLIEKRLNPRVRGALLRMSDIVRVDNEWLDGAASHSFKKCVVPGDDPALKLDRLNQLPLAEQRRIIMKWLAGQQVDQQTLDAESIRRIEQLALAVRGSKTVPLKAGWRVTRVYDKLVLQRGGEGRKTHSFSVEIAVPGETRIPEAGLIVTTEQTRGIVRQKGAQIGRLPVCATINADVIGASPVTVRTWRFGDVFRPLGMEGHMKVQDIFVNRKVPRDCRCLWPLVECRSQIIWMPGYQVGKGWELPDDQTNAIKITITKGP